MIKRYENLQSMILFKILRDLSVIFSMELQLKFNFVLLTVVCHQIQVPKIVCFSETPSINSTSVEAASDPGSVFRQYQSQERIGCIAG